jgi:hypothetical protein
MNSVSRTLLAVAPALMLFATISVPTTASAADGSMAWLGVTMGEPVSSLRQRLGDPLHVRRYPDLLIAAGLKPAADAPQRKMDFWIGGTFALIVSERHGYVVGIELYAAETPTEPVTSLPADPRGALLGQSIAELTQHLNDKPATLNGVSSLDATDASTGLHVRYAFDKGYLNSIRWFRTPAQDMATTDLPELTEPRADGFASAVLDGQTNEASGVRFEYMFVNAHPCDGRTRWKVAQQALVSHDQRKYDVLHVVCPTTQAERNFYFDITRYFGK